MNQEKWQVVTRGNTLRWATNGRTTPGLVMSTAGLNHCLKAVNDLHFRGYRQLTVRNNIPWALVLAMHDRSWALGSAFQESESGRGSVRPPVSIVLRLELVSKLQCSAINPTWNHSIVEAMCHYEFHYDRRVGAEGRYAEREQQAS